MVDQILYADSVEEVASEENPFKKLLKREQRLLDRLQEEQEAEAEAQDRVRRAKTRLQRRRKRVERIQHKLSLVREKLAELEITDQPVLSKDPEVILVPLPEEALLIAAEEESLAQPEEQNMAVQETADLSLIHLELPTSNANGQEQEYTSSHKGEGEAPHNIGDAVMADEVEVSLPQEEFTTPTSFTYEPIEATVEPELEAISQDRGEVEHFAQQEIDTPVPITSEPFVPSFEPEVTTSDEEDTDSSNETMPEHEVAEETETSALSLLESIIFNEHEQEPAMASGANEIEGEEEASESAGSSLATETNGERRPTKPLQVEQPDSLAAESYETSVQSTKEAWIAAESAMQRARNTVNGINTSISFLSQTDGISNEFMEELVLKRAEANRELSLARDTARAAYERFVQAQKDSQSAVSQPAAASTGTLEESSSQQKREEQENATLPPAEENGLDETAKLHATRLYTGW